MSAAKLLRQCMISGSARCRNAALPGQACGFEAMPLAVLPAAADEPMDS